MDLCSSIAFTNLSKFLKGDMGSARHTICPSASTSGGTSPVWQVGQTIESIRLVSTPSSDTSCHLLPEGEGFYKDNYLEYASK